MHYKIISVALAAASSVAAQRPADTPICDYYTTALLKNNTAENQYTLLTLLVNTVVIGNYTMPNVGVKVPGILAAGTYNGAEVNLLPYFNGDLASSNRGGSSGVSVNFLDGGGAAPLMKNMPANDDKSNQYFLLTHLYQFFGSLLGCSQYGMTGFPGYDGHASMYQVHKFMDLDMNELGYFIRWLGRLPLSALLKTTSRQSERRFPSSLGPQLQAICIENSCPISPNSTCASYEAAVAPKNATGGGMMNATATMSGSATSMATATGTMMPSTIPTAGAAIKGMSLAGIIGVLALLL
uniref:Uncharacterized protein n=1 Tax=Colletotrichum fructicola (strain Nara gc5) TaxID=1213859 RepID=L2FXE9_COLFN